MLASPHSRLKSITVLAVSPLALTFVSGEYVVRPGDTATEIAADHDVSLAALVAANRLPAGGNLIFAGETLAIPAAHGPRTQPATGGRPHGVGPDDRRLVWHTVAPGDTVSELASRYHAWTDEVIAENRLSGSADIAVGQRLRIPVVLSALPDRSAPRPATDGEARLPNPSQVTVRRVIEQIASGYGVDPQLALAVSWQEAGWQQDHISSAKAIGAMQVLPSTGRWIETVIGGGLDLRNLRDNVTAGVVLLRQLTEVAPLRTAVAGYYQGLAGVHEHGMYADTRQYVRNVLALKAQFERGDYPY